MPTSSRNGKVTMAGKRVDVGIDPYDRGRCRAGRRGAPYALPIHYSLFTIHYTMGGAKAWTADCRFPVTKISFAISPLLVYNSSILLKETHDDNS